MARNLKARNEMDKRWQWRLEDIFPSDEAYEQAYLRAQADVEKMSAWQGRVEQDPGRALRDADDLAQQLDRLGAYAMMRRDEDGADPQRQACAARFQTLAVSAGSALSFLDPELLALPEETLSALAKDPAYADYSERLRLLLLQKPHTLPAEQEKLLAEAGNVLRVPHDVFSVFSDVDLPLPEVTGEDGEKVQLTHGNYMSLMRSRRRETRREAFEAMQGAYGKFGSTLAACYAGAVKGAVFEARARRYDSARQASLAPHEIPEALYDNLISAVEEGLGALTEYMKVRRRLLGVDAVHMYDLYVPMIDGFDIKLTYPQACDLVCEGLAPLGGEYVAGLREGFAGGWVDVYENKAKRSGAYSWGCYGAHPFVLLNHTDDLGGAMTLAHEMGHSMHTYYSNRSQPFAKAGYSLFVAEVASTCNEVLLMRHLMKKYAGDARASAYLCNQLLEEFRTTVFRQTMFAAFEKEAHAMFERGEALTQDALRHVYLQLNQRYYGGGCEVDGAIACEWMRIPHFYRNFYVYQYATGFSAAVAIADRILREGEAAVRDYRRFLSAGCSVPPLEALRFAGVDMEKPDAVRDGMRVFAETVESLKKLV